MKPSRQRIFAFVLIFVMLLAASLPALHGVVGRNLHAEGGYRVYLPLIVNIKSAAITWNTFLGSASDDFAESIAIDWGGSIYVTGYSVASWGTPINPYAGDYDVFVAKLDSNGVLQWNTFLGSTGYDIAYGISVDGIGDVYVTGYSVGTWGAPVMPYAGGGDGFVAKLNPSGVLQWNTFLGSASNDDAESIALDGNGNVYVAGSSAQTWGAPVNPYAAKSDGYAAKLNTAGALQWNTFLGAASADSAYGIALDGSGNVYVAGSSAGTWGAPVNPYTGGGDAFAAKLDGSGVRQWNTFLGSAGADYAIGIALDGSGNVYLAGSSAGTWGNPVIPYAGGGDAFAAKLNTGGARQWNTFLGSAGDDSAIGIALDGSGYVYVTGSSAGTWGTPVRPYAAGLDGFAAKLNASGARQWNTFLGSANDDYAIGIARDGSGNVYAAGASGGSWGAPVNSYTGGDDAFVVKMQP